MFNVFKIHLTQPSQLLSVLLLATCVLSTLYLVALIRLQDSVKAAIPLRYRYGLSRYMEQPRWQATLDRIHRYLSCCGADSYKDWYTSTWIPLRLLPPSADPAIYSKVVQPNGRLLVPLTPSSCCRSAGDHCGHLAWLEPHNRSWDNIKPTDPQLLHSEGCSKAVSRIVRRDLILFAVFLFILIILQVSLLVVSRYVLDRPLEHSTSCWLLGPCWCMGKNKERGYEDGSRKPKQKWKCVEKLRGRSAKDTDSEGTKSPKPKRKFLQSPCLNKIRGRSDKEIDSDGTKPPITNKKLLASPCLTKLRDKCRKTQRVSKKSEDLLETDSHKKSDISKVGFSIPEEVQYRVENRFENIYNQNYSRNKGKLSASMTDVEDIDDQDFQQTKRLFENMAKKQQIQNEYSQDNKHTQVEKRYPSYMVDLHYGSNKKNNLDQPVKSSISLEKKESESPNIVLRNYRIPAKN